jgi:flagellar protein FlaG
MSRRIKMDINRLTSINAGQSRIAGLKDQGGHPHNKGREDDEGNPPLSRENVDSLATMLNSATKSMDRKITFAVDNDTHRIVMKVQDSRTNETVREIPPRELIRLLKHMHDFIGMFVDESR